MVDAERSMAIDVGGTFTDVVLFDRESGVLRFAKVLTTPDDPSRGSIEGAREILERAGAAPTSIAEMVHASTVATNAVLERKGAKIGLVTTHGFRDTLEIGRESRYDIYDLNLRMPAPLVPRQRRLEVKERVSVEGEILIPLDENQAAKAIAELVDQHEIEALAICLLNGFAFPDHERRLVAIARELYPDLVVSASHQVAAEIREYERSSTTAVDAYVKPMVRRYVGRLSEELAGLGLQPQVAMMLSHGGIGPAREVAESYPVRMIESGPAAGAIAAAHFARTALDVPNAIAFDMGGTTAKISVIREGEPAVTNAFEVGHVHRFKRGSGLPLQISAIELLEIGAGGGSIAHVNDLGLLNVGPQSAGAAPGPACYGLGGDRPTVTDADLLLGYLDPRHFLGGDMELDAALSRTVMSAHIGERLGLSVGQVAWGIHDLVNENMAAATRAHAAEGGIDLRRYSLIAFGGAGPVHAYAIARKLGMRRVLCPFGAGVASAIGCLVAPPAIDLVSACEGPLDGLDWRAVSRAYEEMRRQGEEALGTLIGTDATLRLQASMDLRCRGQGYSITVSMVEDSAFDVSAAASLKERFGTLYRQVYGHRPPEVPLEVVALRARIGQMRKPIQIASGSVGGRTEGVAALKGRRKMRFASVGDAVEGDVYDRYALSAGSVGAGPAVIEERETSTVVGPDARFHVDDALNLIIELER
jgi:N-methylhydantoinase A